MTVSGFIFYLVFHRKMGSERCKHSKCSQQLSFCLVIFNVTFKSFQSYDKCTHSTKSETLLPLSLTKLI